MHTLECVTDEKSTFIISIHRDLKEVGDVPCVLSWNNVTCQGLVDPEGTVL